MKVIRDFKIEVDRNNVLSAINSYYTISEDSEAIMNFENLEKLVLDTIKPVAYFKLDKSPAEISSGIDILKNCKQIIYSIVTIGEAITDLIDGCFNNNQFEKGLILDAISTFILFDLSNQLNERIYKFTASHQLGLTCRIAPGDGEIDINYQRNILESFTDNPDFEFSLVDNYLIKPYKSLCYIFGADENIKINHLDHKCDQCHNINCIMRNSTKKIRGPYETNSELETDI